MQLFKYENTPDVSVEIIHKLDRNYLSCGLIRESIDVLRDQFYHKTIKVDAILHTCL